MYFRIQSIPAEIYALQENCTSEKQVYGLIYPYMFGQFQSNLL